MRRLLLLALFCVLLCQAGAATAATIDDLINKLPASSASEGQKIIAQIVKLGPPAYEDLSKKLVAPGTGDDSKVRFAMHGLAVYVVRPGAEAERRLYVRSLVKALGARDGREVKAFLIRQLQLAGKDDAVEPLSGYLGQETLCEGATQALTRIGTPKAAGALNKALPGASGRNLITIIRALGELRFKPAAKHILKHAMSTDAITRRTALWALANIGDFSAAEVLKKAAETEAKYERARVTDFYLLFAKRLAEAGDKRACAAICREFVKTRTDPRENNVVCAALSTLVSAIGEDAMADLLATADSEDKKIREAALKLAAAIPGEAATAKWVARAKTASPATRGAIVAMLGRRGDEAGRSAVLAALKDKEQVVRLAAITSARRFGTQEAMTGLFEALGDGNPAEVNAIRRELSLLPSSKVVSAAAAALGKVPPRSRAALIELLASRKAKEHVNAVFAAASDPDDGVRVAALKALSSLADEKAIPKIVDLLLKARRSAERAAAQKVIVALSGKIPDPEKRADAILAALGKTAGEKRALLLQVLPRIGGKKALAAVIADTKRADGTVRDAAIRAMTAWPNADAAPELLNVARNAAETTHQVLALRAYIRLIALPSKRPTSETLSMYKAAMNAAKLPEDRKAVLAGIVGVKDINALKFVASYLDDKEVAAEAALAAVKMAEPAKKGEKGLVGSEVEQILKKVIAVAKDTSIQNQAKQCLTSMLKSD